MNKIELIETLKSLKNELDTLPQKLQDNPTTEMTLEKRKEYLENEKEKLELEKENLEMFERTIKSRNKQKNNNHKRKIDLSELYRDTLKSIALTIYIYIGFVFIFAIIGLFAANFLNEKVFPLFNTNVYKFYFGYLLLFSIGINVVRYLILGIIYLIKSPQRKEYRETYRQDNIKKEEQIDKNLSINYDNAKKNYDKHLKEFKEQSTKYKNDYDSNMWDINLESQVQNNPYLDIYSKYNSILPENYWSNIDEIIEYLNNNRCDNIPSAIKLVEERKSHDEIINEINRAKKEAQDYAYRQRMATEQYVNESINKINKEIDEHNKKVDDHNAKVEETNKKLDDLKNFFDDYKI